MATAGPIALTLLLAAAQPAPPPSVLLTDDGEPAEFYSCLLNEQVADGGFNLYAQLALDGRIRGFSAEWMNVEQSPYLRTRLVWEGATFDAMAANSRIELQIDTVRQGLGRAELRRERNGSPLFAGPDRAGQMKYVALPWRRIEAWLRAPGGLVIAVRLADGRSVSRRRLDAGPFDAATAAIAAGRARLEAMIADYRNLCRPDATQEIAI